MSHLLGRGGIFMPRRQLDLLSENATREIYRFQLVGQHILHIFLYTQPHTDSTQTLLCYNVLIQYVHTGCWRPCAQAQCIAMCFRACTWISSSFQRLHSWPSRHPRGRRQLCGGAVQRAVCAGGGDAYLTPRGKFEMVQYQLKQYTLLHLTEMGPSS